jgi:hypothetical protein
VRYEGQCQMLVMLVKAHGHAHRQCGPASPALAAQVVAGVDRILSEFPTTKQKAVPCARP